MDAFLRSNEARDAPGPHIYTSDLSGLAKTQVNFILCANKCSHPLPYTHCTVQYVIREGGKILLRVVRRDPLIAGGVQRVDSSGGRGQGAGHSLYFSERKNNHHHTLAATAAVAYDRVYQALRVIFLTPLFFIGSGMRPCGPCCSCLCSPTAPCSLGRRIIPRP